MRKRPFTAEEIAILESNPNTLQATKDRIQLTLAAKKKIMEFSDAGYSSSRIIRALGYDLEMLGRGTVDGIVYCVKKEAQSERGLHEGYGKRKPKRLGNDELASLPANHETVIQLINEVMYLRQEVGFLKKLSALGESKKRGDSQ